MDDSRESGNDKPKSKKHKKHKKSKKAAITLDEFLNMNKDLFGDGLDVQGIEEVPTTHVLKKCKGKNAAKPIPASAIAKLKKQGITVKSNSNIKSPIPKTNKNIIVNRAKTAPNHIPVKAQEQQTVATSNELLTKLLNQGNSQIKIVKRSSEDHSNKNIALEQDNKDLAVPSYTQNKCTEPSDAEKATENKDNEMDQDGVDVHPKSEINDQEQTKGDNISGAENSENMPQELSEKTLKNETNIQDTNDNVTKIETLDEKAETDSDMQTNYEEDDYETKDEATDGNIPGITEIMPGPPVKEDYQQEYLSKTITAKPLDALKHLRGVITIKPAQSAEDKSDPKVDDERLSPERDSKDETEVLGKNVQNVALNKSTVSPSSTLTTSLNKLKNLNSQLSIKSMSPGSSVSKSDEEKDDTDYDNECGDELTNKLSCKNVVNEEENAIFKTPVATVKQTNVTAKLNQALDVKKPIQSRTLLKESIKDEDDTKKSLNMDILKRLTNVTAKPIVRPQNNVQATKSSVQRVNSPKPFIPKVEKNKTIDQDIEIFNIDDSDSDQEAPHDDPVSKCSTNTAKSTDDIKTTASANVLKNLSKNITVKLPSTSIKNVSNINNDIQHERSSPSLEKSLQNTNNSDSKSNIQKKQINMNLSQTLKKIGNNISIKSQYTSPDPHRCKTHQDDYYDDMDDHFNDDESDSELTTKVKISEVQDDEELPSDTDMEYNENVIVQSPHASNSENEEEHHSNHSDEETAEDFEKQIKMSTISQQKANVSLSNFKINNKELTIKSLNEKNTDFSQTGSSGNPRVVKNPVKDNAVKQNRGNEKNDVSEVTTKKINQTAASSSASQKVTNQVNTVKTVKSFESETIIEEITTTVTKTIRTVNQSSKQVAQNANINTYRPRLVSPNNQVRPLQGMIVRNAQSVGPRVRHAAPSPRAGIPLRPAGQLVPMRPQNQIVQRQGVFRPNTPGPSNVKKISPPTNVQKPVIGKPLKISPLAMNQSIKRHSEDAPGPFSCFKKPKDSIIPPMDGFDDDFGEDSTVNYSSATSSRSDFSTTATKIVKGKAVVTATQARSEQHSEQHITKLNNMSGLKIVRTSAKQASQVETRSDNNVGTAKRNTLDAIERLQKQGLLIKKPRVEEPPEEQEQYNSEGDNEYDEQ